jgi:hypothetical protein
MTTARRGQVYSVDMGGDRGRHYYVVVSNNNPRGVLSRPTMEKLDAALKIAFGLT